MESFTTGPEDPASWEILDPPQYWLRSSEHFLNAFHKYFDSRSTLTQYHVQTQNISQLHNGFPEKEKQITKIKTRMPSCQESNIQLSMIRSYRLRRHLTAQTEQ